MSESLKNEKVSKPDEMSLKDLINAVIAWFKFLLSKWKIVVLAGVIGAALGFTYAYLNTPLYKAELTFTVDDGKSASGNGAFGLASQFGLDVGGGSNSVFSGDNLLLLIKSRTIIEKALLSPVVIKNKEKALIEYYIDFNGIRSGWSDNPKLKGVHFSVNDDPSKFSLVQDSIITDFYRNLSKGAITVEKQDGRASIISLRVVSTDELFAKYFDEILAKVVSDFYIQTQTKKEAANVTILQRQTDSVRQALNNALAGVAASADFNPNPNPSLQILRVPSQRRQVDVQANQAMLTQLVSNLEIAKIALRKETPLIQVIDKPILPLEKQKFAKKKGLILGTLLAVILAAVLLTLGRLYKKIVE